MSIIKPKIAIIIVYSSTTLASDTAARWAIIIMQVYSGHKCSTTIQMLEKKEAAKKMKVYMGLP